MPWVTDPLPTIAKFKLDIMTIIILIINNLTQSLNSYSRFLWYYCEIWYKVYKKWQERYKSKQNKEDNGAAE